MFFILGVIWAQLADTFWWEISVECSSPDADSIDNIADEWDHLATSTSKLVFIKFVAGYLDRLNRRTSVMKIF